MLKRTANTHTRTHARILSLTHSHTHTRAHKYSTGNTAKENGEDGEEILFGARRIVLAKVAVEIASECVHAETRVVAVQGDVLGDLIGEQHRHRGFHEKTHDHENIADKRYDEEP